MKNNKLSLEELVSESRTFESDRIKNLETSRRIAWRVCMLFVVFSFLLAGAIFFMLPLKETKLYVVRVDNTTGYTDIVPSLTDNEFTPEEALNRFWVSHYIELRERYVYETLQQDYEQVQVYGSENVNRLYVSSFAADDAPHKQFGDRFLITPKILSITLNETGGETPTKTALVRVELVRTNLLSKEVRRKRVFITVSYDYMPALKMPLENRTQNPLGFQILSYSQELEMSER